MKYKKFWENLNLNLSKNLGEPWLNPTTHQRALTNCIALLPTATSSNGFFDLMVEPLSEIDSGFIQNVCEKIIDT